MKKMNYSLNNRKAIPGWTFIETIIVIGIILILTAGVGVMAFKYIDQGKTASVKAQIDVFALALNAYNVDTKQFPSENQGLNALWMNPGDVEGWNGPYVSKAIPKDPWNRSYIYKIPGPNNLPFEIISYGADGISGGDGNNADISSSK